MTAAFPSLVIRADGFSAEGAFAEAQASFLDPDPEQVARLDALLRARNVGVVSHFYMDAELQGVLYACCWPHIHISDSLVMADRGVEMVRQGVKNVVVLGVDFMAENVRAMMDAAALPQAGVYRVAAQPIGCSLAEAAESRAYAAYLERASRSMNPLHVVYINTSLRTKAHAHQMIPTLTCTSSNVVQSVLQAFAQEPKINLWFGPDTYMGENLRALFEGLATMDDMTIAALHPAHDRQSIRDLLGRFHYFEQGTCIVHHMFGDEVVRTLRSQYSNAHISAHLEVPGSMFLLALECQREGRGVVGSTANILNYVKSAVDKAAEGERISVVLGTEAGMVTALARAVRALLRQRPSVEVEIVFPVAAEAISSTQDPEFPVIPGVAGGEGCSVAGGCATCPFMKMNSLDALMDILERMGGEQPLAAYEPRCYGERLGGKTVAEVGSQPILHMRDFQRDGVLSVALLDDIRGRTRRS